MKTNHNDSNVIRSAFHDFIERLELILKEKPGILINTLSNIFAMRAVGNKTHGDLAEIGLSEFINYFVYDFSSLHVGKENYRKKTQEEDISVTSKVGAYKGVAIPISVKAYGIGPLQLSTDKENQLYRFLQAAIEKEATGTIEGTRAKQVLGNAVFQSAANLNVLSLIYDEKNRQCNIMPFDLRKAFAATKHIVPVVAGQTFDFRTQSIISKGRRKHPIFLFLDKQYKYLCEVRYGDASANALQRGIWTNTRIANPAFFRSLTGGWVSYSKRPTLVQLIAVALNATASGHKAALKPLEKDIQTLKRNVGLS